MSRATELRSVWLVSMPFGPLFSPSLALSLLKASLAAQGMAARVRYFSLDFAERIGQAFYSDIAAEGRPPLITLAGEWIFSSALFPSCPEDEDRYVAEVLRRPDPVTYRGSAKPVTAARARRIRRVRAAVAPFLEACLAEIVRDRPALVGFTSTFQQHLASLALARRIKQALPETMVVMGGANCEGVMGAEAVRQFPFLDAVVSGEGEYVLPELARRALASRPLSGLPGVRTREGVEEEFRRGTFPNAPTTPRLDDLPYPDFSDFFDQFGASRYPREWEASLFFETSRGCWWGERSHCTFCGLNGSSMTYRSKSARRAVDELAQLAAEHPGCDIQVTDNILDMGYFKDFLPALAERRLGVDLFYETKSNLKKDQVRLLRQAGVRRIQPGIESFSDSVLKIMRKGVTGLQNIQLLKWCKEVGVEPHWNIIWGFPGEDPAEYARMARLVPKLAHLAPPIGFSDLRLDRFSPNFFEAERLGLEEVVPLPSYHFLYPALSGEARANLAYFFGFTYREPRNVDDYVRPLVRALRAWARTSSRGDSDLFSVDAGGRLLAWDLRPAARQPLTVLSGLDRLLYLACDAAVDLRSLADATGGRGREAATVEEIEDRLGRLVDAGLVIREGTRFLALAVPLGEYAPTRAVVERFHAVVRALGRPLTRGRRRPSALAPSHFVINGEGELRIGELVGIPYIDERKD
ncbi:MAG TPA: RiPP maturation radical SAM C-methyltransferase [Vicinamibacteria bacterium]|nr:RiPP maturation radical SAM C-methyltransferase [Vicinamibacteria bacterium]